MRIGMMRGSTLNRHSSCVWRRDSYFVMILMSLISSLVLVSSVSLVSSQPEPDPAALSADPHGGSNEQADNPSHETAATNIPKIESVAGRRSYYIGNTAQLECVVRDLEPFAIIWRKGLKQLLYAGPTKISQDSRIIMKNWVLEIANLNANDTGEYVCEVSTTPPMEIMYDLKVVPEPIVKQGTTPAAGHAKNPNAKNHSHPSLSPSSSSVACSSATGIALLSLFLNNYFVRQA